MKKYGFETLPVGSRWRLAVPRGYGGTKNLAYIYRRPVSQLYKRNCLQLQNQKYWISLIRPRIISILMGLGRGRLSLIKLRQIVLRLP